MPNVNCGSCGFEFHVKPSHLIKVNCCSVKCKNKYRADVKASNTTNCKNCGKEFVVMKSRSKYGRGINCSRKCQYEQISKNKKGVKLFCINCGGEFYRWKSHIKKRGSGKYCSNECKNVHRKGENHPQYLGNAPYKRGANWQSQKRKALKRDKITCQKCGSKNNIQVHHIIPFRYFNKDYITANDLSNLICLCDKCHRAEDAIIQKLERDETDTRR